MVEFHCPTCDQVRIGARRRCYPCTISMSPEAREKIRRTMTGRRYSEARKAHSREGLARKRAAGWQSYDIGSLTRGQPSPKRKTVGYTRVVKDGRVQVKCEDGKFRYRARIVWVKKHGPITRDVIIHHKNEEPMDDRLSNLQAVTRAQHAALHSTPEKMRAAQLLGAAARRRKRAK